MKKWKLIQHGQAYYENCSFFCKINEWTCLFFRQVRLVLQKLRKRLSQSSYGFQKTRFYKDLNCVNLDQSVDFDQYQLSETTQF